MRRHPDLSQADIARACEVTTPSVAGWLNGNTKSLRPEPARLGAKLFGCDQNWLSTGVGLPTWRDISTDTATEPGSAATSTAPIPPPLREALPVVLHALSNVPADQRQELLDVLAMCVKYGNPEDAQRLASLLRPVPAKVSMPQKAA